MDNSWCGFNGTFSAINNINTEANGTFTAIADLKNTITMTLLQRGQCWVQDSMALLAL